MGALKLATETQFYTKKNLGLTLREVLSQLQQKSVFELGVTEKLKLLTAMMNQMLTFAGVRDELDNRMGNIFETKAELKQTTTDENKRLQELDRERIKKK